MKYEKGFSILEVMVVIAVMTIVMTIVVVTMTHTAQSFSLNRVVTRFNQDLRFAQQKAFSGTIYRDALGAEHAIDGYGVYINTSVLGNTTYLIYADHAPGNHQYDGLDYIIETVNFQNEEPGIIIQQIDQVGGSMMASFHFYYPRTIITPLQIGYSDAQVVFALTSNPAQKKRVIVTTAGLIEVR